MDRLGNGFTGAFCITVARALSRPWVVEDLGRCIGVIVQGVLVTVYNGRITRSSLGFYITVDDDAHILSESDVVQITTLEGNVLYEREEQPRRSVDDYPARAGRTPLVAAIMGQRDREDNYSYYRSRRSPYGTQHLVSGAYSFRFVDAGDLMRVLHAVARDFSALVRLQRDSHMGDSGVYKVDGGYVEQSRYRQMFFFNITGNERPIRIHESNLKWIKDHNGKVIWSDGTPVEEEHEPVIQVTQRREFRRQSWDTDEVRQPQPETASAELPFVDPGDRYPSRINEVAPQDREYHLAKCRELGLAPGDICEFEYEVPIVPISRQDSWKPDFNQPVMVGRFTIVGWNGHRQCYLAEASGYAGTAKLVPIFFDPELKVEKITRLPRIR